MSDWQPIDRKGRGRGGPRPTDRSGCIVHCRSCDTDLPRSAFASNASRNGGIAYRCKQCSNKRRRHGVLGEVRVRKFLCWLGIHSMPTIKPWIGDHDQRCPHCGEPVERFP